MADETTFPHRVLYRLKADQSAYVEDTTLPEDVGLDNLHEESIGALRAAVMAKIYAAYKGDAPECEFKRDDTDPSLPKKT